MSDSPGKFALSLVAGATLVVLLLISLGIDWGKVSAGGTIDFRNRITGARLLWSHRDAYHYKWKMHASPELCDPYNNPVLPISRVTVTPTLLMLNFPLGALPYRVAQFIWLLGQWLLLLGAGFLWWRAIPTTGLRWLWAAALVGFTFTVAWRHHTDRGQAYVVMLFLLAAWMALTRHPQIGSRWWGALLAGLVAGLLVAVRPPLVLLLGPWILLRRRGQLAGLVLGVALGAGLPLLWSSSCWSDYFSGMQTWSELYRAGKGNPPPGPQAYPPVIEGMSIDVLARFGRSIPFADSSIFGFFRAWGIMNVPALPVALVFVALVGLWFWLSRAQPDDVLFLGIAAWSLLADLFLPAPRNSYNEVLVLNLVALVLIMRGRHAWMLWILLAAWPAGWWVIRTLPRERGLINLPTLIMIAASVLLLLRPVFGKPRPEPGALT